LNCPLEWITLLPIAFTAADVARETPALTTPPLKNPLINASPAFSGSIPPPGCPLFKACPYSFEISSTSKLSLVINTQCVSKTLSVCPVLPFFILNNPFCIFLSK